MKKFKILLFLTGATVLCNNAFATYAVFDATNNVLASLQKTMDSAFQTIQKANMATLIKQAKEDFAEQIKIYEECVKQYEECVKIYDRAVKTYNWIDTNVGQAKNIKTFLSCNFSNPNNIKHLQSLVNTTLAQTASATNRLYNSTLLKSLDNLISADVADARAKRGVERQKYAQAARKVADRSDSLAQSMLTSLQAKDRMLESRVSSGTADLMQLTHANEQGTMFIAEELARVNSNVSAINRTQARQEEAMGEDEMNRAQEAAVYSKLEKQAIDRGSSYTRQQDSRTRINNIFRNCRVF